MPERTTGATQRIPVKPETLKDLRDLARYADVTYDEAVRLMMSHFIATDQNAKVLWERVLRDRSTIEKVRRERRS